ncbi:MAG TPA: efflux RND transporter periplasmic adaptor subunit [Prolixibacteraceae bacterium]|nr:efflux RND transporter periplasmic adaptor subunit [Prolixibacteraceae bacterium]
MKKVFKILGIVLLVAIFLGTFYFLYSKSKKKPVIYTTQTPVIETISQKSVATGSVIPRKEIEIKPQVSGIIEEVYLQAGEMVKNGDIIAKVKIIPDMVTLNNAESRVNRAKLNYEDAKIDYDRQKELFDKKVIAYEEYQKAQLAFNTSREEMNSAEDNLDLIKKGVTKKSATTTNTLIRSTIDGMLLSVPIEVGNSVIQANTFNAGTTIAIVADMTDIIFKGKVDETEVGKIKEGMDIILTIGAIDNEKFDATLTYLSPKGVEENGAIQFEIKADVNLKEGQFIRAGYSANASILLEQRNSVLVIPEAYLKFENEKAYVEVELDSQQFEKRFIEVGLSDGINIEVLNGLTIEEKIKGEKIDPKKAKTEAKETES